MQRRALATAALLLLALAPAARAVTVAKTNKASADDMPSVPVPDDQKSRSGYYQPLGQAPIAVAHALQLPCGNKFLMMEFGPTGKEGKLMLPHPASNYKGRNIMQVYDRDADTWTDVPTNTNSVCGGWARLANGQVGLFAGHYATLDVYQVDGMKAIKVFDPSSYTLTTRSNLTAKRWYPTTLTLPNGDVYVPGGTWAQKPNGIWPRAEGADIYTHAYDRVARKPLNPAMQNAGLGNWYIGALVLPTGQVAMMNARMMQVVDPYSGEALASAPPLPEPVKDLTWEFPRMGPQVHLRMPVLKPGKEARIEFMAFGGSYVDPPLAKAMEACPHTGPNRNVSEWKPCADVAVRIGLTVTTDGRHVFDDAWEVEKMPGPRCIFDGMLLPNGHVVLLGGQKLGLGDLTDGGPASKGRYNGGHEPYNEPWIYNPSAPAGSRFMRTGAKTRIARMYHATSILTKDGDIFVGGTSNAGFWQSSHEADFSRTPLGVNEYRAEIYHPPYVFRPNRPRITSPPPTFVPYGTSFEVGYAFDSPAQVSGVVLVNAGGVTHNYAIGHRSQLLDFAVARRLNATHGVLRVEAPAAPQLAPPSHYMLFLLRGETYSPAAWVQLRRPPAVQVPVDFPQESKAVAAMSSGFEPSAPARYSLLTFGGRRAAAFPRLNLAAGTGAGGARVSVGAGAPAPGGVLLRSAPARLEAGAVCNVQLWARAVGRDAPLVAQLVRLAGDVTAEGAGASYRLEAGAVGAAAASPQQGSVVGSQRWSLQAGPYCLHVFGPINVAAGGTHVLQLDLGAAEAGSMVDVDDIEVYCT